MSDYEPHQPDRADDSGPSGLLFGAGAALFAVVCCAGPALLAAGALGAFGAWLANPWVIGAGIALLVGAVAWTVRRRGTASNPDACCEPERRDQPGLPRTNREDH